MLKYVDWCNNIKIEKLFNYRDYMQVFWYIKTEVK